jgi:hypothetical protein
MGTGRHNLSRAIKQKQLVQNWSLSPFVFLEWRKKQDGVTLETKRLLNLWWTIETQVSPNKKRMSFESALEHINMNFMQHIAY